MKDLIAERDKKQKMQQSIVKWWNVHYMTPEELAEEQEKEEASASVPSDSGGDQMVQEPEKGDAADISDTAQEILDRLNHEAAADEARKQREIEEARIAAEANFNETTGSYSGEYGASGASGEHKEKIDAILAEKDDALRDLIQRTEEE